MLLEPNKKMFESYLDMLENKIMSNNNKLLRNNNNNNDEIGFADCFSMLDEQTIAYLYYFNKVTWHHIDYKYNFIPWLLPWLKHTWEENVMDCPFVIHYFSNRPWQQPPTDSWSDLLVWWTLAYHCCQSLKPNLSQYLLKRYFDHSKFNMLLPVLKQSKCFWCEQLSKSQSFRQQDLFHSFLDIQTGSIACPNCTTDTIRIVSNKK
ncbi:hypothetical protein RFI_32940 [Reticulomyxa filosa]|uniref:Uncharacterized protein n=1 Tax=Reticulomyxa filosa TaxID=46433 RepID=X6LRG7_RETFI|nr:hypothetical protein RFI_32940 [Reticulomyxa filosa]|eukprot:ETO04458.1 hypothetical protein RFI_32940 [Reticulomyxa filosa]